MTSKVRVTADENGNVVTISEKNPDFAHIRVVQNSIMFDENGWLKAKQLSALIHADTATLLAMNYQPDQELPGNIIIKEALMPFSNNDSDRDLKYAGSTGIVCRVDDQPIYRKTFYTETPNMNHELIHHTNSDEIRAANAIQRSTPVADFMNALSKVNSDFVVAQ